MSILKLKNRLQGLEKELFGHHGRRIPVEESCLVVEAGTSITQEELDKKFKILKDKLREKYGDFDEETDIICCHAINRWDFDESGEAIPSPFAT